MLAEKPIPRVLSRHNLLMGAEREPVLVSAMLCGGVAVSSMTLIGFGVCAGLWFGSLTVWRWMAKADPQMTKVYQRSLKYRAFYPAFSRPYRDPAASRTPYYVLAGVVVGVLFWVL